MNDFINKVVNRHMQSEPVIKPRARSRFEPMADFTSSWTTNNVVEETSRSENLEHQEESVPSPQDTNTLSLKPDQKQVFKQTDRSPNFPKIEPVKEKEPPAEMPKAMPTLEFSQLSPIQFPAKAPKNQIRFDQPIKTKPTISEKNASPEPITEKVIPEPATVQQNPWRKLNKNKVVDSLDDAAPPIVKPSLSNKRKPIMDTESSSTFSENSAMPIPRQQQTALDFFALQPAPTIKVNIGRIEVRAIVEQTPPPATRKRAPLKPNMSLEDYLKKQK